MNLHELRPNLRLTELVLGDFDVRGAVVAGERRVLVWDTLSHPRDMEAVRALAGNRSVDVVYSHADWDHCWGTAGLDAELVIAHEACGRRFQVGEVAHKLAEKREAEPGEWEAVHLIPPALTFSQSVAIDLGGLMVELHHLPGHTEDCLVAWIPQWGVLLAGDTVETPLPYLNAKSVELLPYWIGALETWAANERVQTVVPAHGEVGDRSVITGNISYLRALRAGKFPLVPEVMDDFYMQTHAQNQALVRNTKL